MNRCGSCCNKQLVPSCQVPVVTESGNAVVCGETESLDIIGTIREEFEKKMKQIDSEAGGDCLPGLQAKLHLQQEWISSLTVQNEMLVDAVKELETEATKRVSKLQEKLESNAPIGSGSMVDACSSLTLEDVGKNDMILNLRRDLQRVEENYQKLIQRCQYKDSIIMALRKQIKMLKGEGFSPLNLQSHIPKIPGSVWHKCCPYVKDVCPLYKKTNISHLPSAADFERLKSALKIYSSDGIQNTAIDDDQTPTHDSLIPVPVFPHYERAKSFSADDSKKHKQKTKLTATGVLHEYYDLKESEKLQRSLEVSSKIANKIDITVPNHVSVKTFVHNFERTAFFKTDNNEEKLKTEDTSK